MNIRYVDGSVVPVKNFRCAPPSELEIDRTYHKLHADAAKQRARNARLDRENQTITKREALLCR